MAETILAKLKTSLRYVLLGGLYVLSFVWPRDDTLWVFGAKGGDAFLDNSKYLFLYTVAERRNIQAVWLSRDLDVVEELRAHGYESYHAGSLRGLWMNLRAGVAFISDGMADINISCSGGATVVVLWHGIALKRFGWDHGRIQNGWLAQVLESLKGRLFKRFNWVTVTSEAMIEPFASAIRISPERILVTGYPRNDFLVDALPNYSGTDATIYQRCRQLHDESTVIVYAPTYHWATGEHVDEHVDLDKIDQWLVEADAHLVVKPHPNEPLDINESDFSRIIPMASGLDIYPLLKQTDVLITDYSSVYFDYLLLDRPVVFYPFDFDEYQAERGFYLDYATVTPGPIATDFDGLLQALESVCEGDAFVDERRRVRERFLQTSPGDRCAAICDRFDPSTNFDDERFVEATTDA